MVQEEEKMLEGKNKMLLFSLRENEWTVFFPSRTLGSWTQEMSMTSLRSS